MGDENIMGGKGLQGWGIYDGKLLRALIYYQLVQKAPAYSLEVDFLISLIEAPCLQQDQVVAGNNLEKTMPVKGGLAAA